MPDAKFVYILDFSYDPETLVEISKDCMVVVLDHHKTAQEKLTPLIGKHDNLHIEFDMERSGALMAWEYFHDEPVPDLIRHISDRDLWQFKLTGTSQVHKALVSYPMDFNLWDSLDIEQLKLEGATCERMYSSLVNNIVASSWVSKIAGKKCAVVNTSIAWSEVGEALLEKHQNVEFAASFTVFNGQVMWSLRSRDEFDVSEVAKQFGGGGHKNAAGFKIKTETGLTSLIKD